MSLDFKRQTEIITNIEKSIDVNSITYNTMHIWPLIRLAMYMRMHVPDKTRKNFVYEILSCFKNVVNFLVRDYFCKINYHYFLRKISNFKECDCLFFSRSVDHTDTIDGRSFDRFVDPLMAFARKRYGCLKMELGSGYFKNPRFEKTEFVTPYVTRGYEIIARKKTKKINKIDGLSEIEKKYKELTGEIISKEWIVKYADFIELYTVFFKAILARINPKAVFLVCYYCPAAMALIRACKQLNIKTVDIQHGCKSVYHPMYGFWTRLPVNGYDLLPDYYWVWGKQSRANMLNTRHGYLNNKSRVPLVGGNLWINYYRQNKDLIDTGLNNNILSRISEKYSKVVLFLCSGEPDFNDLIAEHVLNIMVKAPEEWLWLIRLHPHWKNRIDEMITCLSNKGVKNFEVKAATLNPLYKVFDFADVVVTQMSTGSIEAIEFDLPVIIAHSMGRDFYHEYIEGGIFSYAPNEASLLEVLNDKNKRDVKSYSKQFIETSDEVAEEALKTIMESS